MSNFKKSLKFSWNGEGFSSTVKITLLVFLLTLPQYISKGCGPYEIKFEGYSFINPNIVNTQAEFARYFLRFDDLYRTYNSVQEVQQNKNLIEWNERFCNLFDHKDLSNVIYKATVQEMKSIRNAANDKKSSLPKRFKKSDFADHLRDEKCMEVIDYLIYAKHCEKHTIPDTGWATPKRDFAAMKELIEEGKKIFYKTKSHYVRLRYTYQIIRLAHYGKGYNSVLKLHEELMPKVHANPSLMDYWIMGHKAGALFKLGKRVEASYLYSLIFANCPSKRQSAYQSFSIKNNKEWEQLQRLCKSDNERAMLYVIRANEDESRAVEEMEKIYDFDPTNENLELLLVKEVRKLEKDLLGNDFNDRKKRNKDYFKLPRKNTAKYLARLQALAKKCVKEKKVNDWNLWRVVDGYLTFLAGDYYEAELAFKKIGSSMKTPNEHLKEQLQVAQLALRVAQVGEEIDTQEENAIGNIIRSNDLYWKYEDFPDYVNDKLHDVFSRTNQKGKAFRVHHTLQALQMNPDLEIIDDLLELCDKENKSNLEEVLVKKDNVTTIKNDLLILRGIKLLRDKKIEAALETFRKTATEERKYNPFHEHIIDCFECPIGDSLMYNRVEVLEEILKLEYDGRAHIETGASSFYQLGNAYYNMSYFGDSWQVMDLFRSGVNWQYQNQEYLYYTLNSELGNSESMDLSKARQYYETALDLAKNKELAARACFGLAKCNLAQYYIDPETDYRPWENKIPILPEKYNFYHLKFIEDYIDTEFYRMVIEECNFFDVY